jgi:hypothetical protein
MRRASASEGPVLPALEVADGLRVDPDAVGQLLAADAPLGPEHGDAVVHLVLVAGGSSTHAAFCSRMLCKTQHLVRTRSTGQGRDGAPGRMVG